MKFTIFLIFSTLLFVTNAFSQNNCPTISVKGPSQITPIDDSMTFTANISGGSFDKVSYEWIASNGTIVSGQNTPTIVVSTNSDLAGQTVTATVKISGLPQNCQNETSESGEVEMKPPIGIFYRKIDEYERLYWRDEKYRLKNAAIETKNDPDSMAIFIFFIPSKENLRNFKLRLTRIGKYLTETENIAKERIRFVFGGYGNYRTNINLLPMSDFGDVTDWGDDIELLFPKTPAKKKPKSIQK